MVGYLEREAGGLLISRARLLGDGWNAEWRASVSSGDGPAADSDPSGVALDRARAVGAWIVQQLGIRRARVLETLVVDGDGAFCLWLGTPSADANVVAAALLQGGSRGDSDGTTGSGDAVMFAAAEGAGTERSVQAAAAPSAEAAAPRRSLLSRGAASAAPEPIRQRLAVMSVPDAAVRVVLDVLDGATIAVDSVTSLWHAAARAWDPSATPAESPSSGRFVGESTSTTAVVLIDPIGRLLWCWTRSGRMLACGSMLLRRVEVGGAVASLLELDDPAGPGAESPLAAVECSDAEASRLCVDWLGWSAQLGVNPERIVYVGPAAAGGTGGAGRAFAQTIGERWPGAFVDAATDDDPVGLTLARARTSVPWQDEAAAVDDGQRALVDLSQRPGRTHRSYYRWMAGAVTAVALVVVALGWKMRAAAGESQGELDTLRASRTEALKALEAKIPGLASHPDPVGRIRGHINELHTRSDRVPAEVPLVQELQRVFAALGAVPGAKISVIDLSNITATVTLRVPNATTGPQITDHLNSLPGQLTWTGSSGGTAGATGGMRIWTLTGKWPTSSSSRPGRGTTQ